MRDTTIPADILDALKLADASWRPHLEAGLRAMAQANPDYLPQLAGDDYLPTGGRLFAALLDAAGASIFGAIDQEVVHYHGRKE